MDVRPEQFIIVIIVILLSLFDLVRRRAGGGTPQGPPVDGDGSLDDVRDFDDEYADGRGLERERVDRRGFDEELAERVARERERTWLEREARPTVRRLPPALEEVMAVRAARPPAPIPSGIRADDVRRGARRRRRAGLRLGPGDARRGIVLLTVLGPCRAEEMDRR